MLYRKLGSEGLVSSSVGLGCFGLLGGYGTTDERIESMAERAILHALEVGVTLFDTADAYGPNTSELLLGRVLQDRRDALIATKFGSTLPWDLSKGVGRYVRESCERSLERLRRDCIDLYYLHRINPEVPVGEVVGAMGELVADGKVRFVGISNASAATIRRAHASFPITAVQNEYSLFTRDCENDVLPTTRELGIGFVAYRPLACGFLAGHLDCVEQLDPKDIRVGRPRFEPGNMRHNRALLAAVENVAAETGATLAQMALAWVLAQADDLVVLPGTRRIEHIDENVGASDLALTEGQLRYLSDAVPAGAVAGMPYADMSWLTSSPP